MHSIEHDKLPIMLEYWRVNMMLISFPHRISMRTLEGHDVVTAGAELTERCSQEEFNQCYLCSWCN
jgi:hypothetical protein